MHPITKLVSEHEEIEEWADGVEAALGGAVRLDTDWLRFCLLFLSSTVFDHFAYEEREAFQAFAACSPSSECSTLIRELVAEHRAIRVEYSTLVELSTAHHEGGEVPAAVLTIIRHILDNLAKHARREEEELVPLVQGDRAEILAWLEQNRPESEPF